MGKKSAKMRNQRGAERRVAQGLGDLDDRPAAKDREWPVRLTHATQNGLWERYYAELMKIAGTYQAQWLSVRPRERPKRLSSFRNIRVARPSIDPCDFLAVLEFEDRHPDLFVDADTVPPYRDDMLDPKGSIPQLDAMYRIYYHPRPGLRNEFRRIMCAFREERDEAKRVDDQTNRFMLDPNGHEAKVLRGYFEDVNRRFLETPDAPMVCCPFCARMGEVDPSCMEVIFIKRDPTIPWTSIDQLYPPNSEDQHRASLAQNWMATVCCNYQPLLARQKAGKQWKWQIGPGVWRPLCANCGKPEENPTQKHQLCAGCERVFYCSRACQREAWPRHKPHCARRPPEPEDVALSHLEWEAAAARQGRL